MIFKELDAYHTHIPLFYPMLGTK